jgi:alkanesulfonate monooxygenase SsuD/methylene tetrahydromethanopterin reductase-like flavin-dependent oxidoreductase (luciferase family)
MVAIIGGEPRRFKPLIDLYRSTGARFGHALDQLKVGVHSLGYVARTKKEAADDFFPGYARAIESVAKERGWTSATRAGFDAFQMNAASLPQDKMLRAIETIGARVAPAVS